MGSGMVPGKLIHVGVSSSAQKRRIRRRTSGNPVRDGNLPLYRLSVLHCWLVRQRVISAIVGWVFVVEGICAGALVVAVVDVEAGWMLKAPMALFAMCVSGFLPIIASIAATFNPHRASRILLYATPLSLLFALLFGRPFGDPRFVFEIFLGSTLIPGVFWFVFSRYKWPPLISKTWFARRRGIAVALFSFFFIVACGVAILASLSLPWWPPIGDCGGRPLIDAAGHPLNIVFTARLLLVGPRSFMGSSLWSAGRVEQRFADVPSWGGNIVFLRGSFKKADKAGQFFVEGQRSTGVLTRFLPIIEPVPCGRTRPLKYADVPLRILQDGLPRDGARLLGRVYRYRSKTPVAGIKVLLDGPDGTKALQTDSSGIFDVSGLRSGEYTVRLEWKPREGAFEDPSRATVWLENGQIGEQDLALP